MPLPSGAHLGPYEITGTLGAGGMGEVYRATDTTLGRQVAIKVLPDAFAHDADRLARFEREAKTLASLNHPNIAQIYGLEKTNDLQALVMELVEGQTLAERIAQGPIPLDEALPIASQIAEALEAAHEQGIIHRDLKPANVKVRPDGMVKVLDFGLAKALEPAVSALSNASMSPTITTPAMTQAGMILGTAAYMSPEQARGKAADRRSDIWAFGAVLFEMLTGQRAFPGEDLADTLAAVVKLDPKWDAVADVPARVRQVLRVCLQKDPKQRAQAIGDVRLALEGAFETAAPLAATTSSARGGRLVWMAAFAVAVLGIVAMAVPIVRHLRETAPPETRTEINTPATDRLTSFALSPDGHQIVFVASGDGVSRLWLRSLATTTAEPMAGTEGATFPFWAPDSRSVGFFAGSALKRLDLGGGTPRTLASVVNGSGGTWSAEGVIVFAPSQTTPLMRVSAAGGAATAVTTLGPQQFGHRAPWFLADGRRFLFRVSGATDATGIYLGAVDGSAPKLLTTTDGALAAAPVSLPFGWLLWVQAGTLVAQQLDLARAVLRDEPVTLADGVAGVSVATTGLVAYRTSAGDQRQLTWFDPSGAAQRTVGDPDSSLVDPRVSPDGRRVTVARTVQGNQDIWMLDGARTSRVTFDAAPEMDSLWSPDGTRIVFRSHRTGAGDLYQKLTSGAGVEDRLLTSDQLKIPTSWSNDGRFLLYHSADPQTGADLWVVPMMGDRTPSVFLKTPFREAYGAFAPAGRWVAYQSNESGRPEVYVRPFFPPGTTDTAAGEAERQWQVSTAGGVFPVWRHDGKELYYLNPEGALMSAPMTISGSTLEPGAPVLLFRASIVGGGDDAQQRRQYDVGRDGRFLINTDLDDGDAPITLLQNWNPDSKK